MHRLRQTTTTTIDSSSHEDYDIFMKLIQEAKNTHFPKKTVKFNKKTQKIEWMTYGILNSFNKKDRLLLKTDVNYAALKATFKNYEETLRRIALKKPKNYTITKVFVVSK